jgi:hypothetical protein
MIPTSICRAFQILDDRLFHTNVPGGQWFSDDEIAWLQAEAEWHREKGRGLDWLNNEINRMVACFINEQVEEQPTSPPLGWLDRWLPGLST